MPLLLLTSCRPSFDWPYGVWYNEDYGITLYIEKEFQIVDSQYVGTHRDETGTIRNLVVSVNSILPQIGIHDTVLAHFWLPQRAIFGGNIMNGDFRLNGDTMRLAFTGTNRRRFGRRLVFHRIETYPPINMEDWLNLFGENGTAVVTSEERVHLRNQNP
ncbi:MAG: hypothetical protein FWG64_07515 [Firmicutes bacterium]|nr:hypothetical protein [Bacillota bacterium]